MTMSQAGELAIDKASGLVPVLADHARQAELDRAVPAEVMTAVADSGLFAMVTPTRYGGDGLGLDALANVTRILAHGDTAMAWTVSFLILHNWLLGRFPDEVCRTVFADHPYAHTPAPLAPTGKMTVVDGGYVVTGKWEWATGVNHADWVMVHAFCPDEGQTRFAVVPIEAVEVLDVWHMSGMCATGSNTVVARDMYVSAEHTITGPQMLNASEESKDPLDRLPLISVLALVASGTALGSAERVLGLFEERTRSRIMAYSLGDKAIDQPSPRMHLAAQSAAVDAARASWQRAIDDLEATAINGEPTLAQRAHARLTAASTVRSSRLAVGELLAAAGASIYNINSPMQRYQRDVEVLKGHAVFDWDRTTELAGRVMLGLDIGVTDMV